MTNLWRLPENTNDELIQVQVRFLWQLALLQMLGAVLFAILLGVLVATGISTGLWVAFLALGASALTGLWTLLLTRSQRNLAAVPLMLTVAVVVTGMLAVITGMSELTLIYCVWTLASAAVTLNRRLFNVVLVVILVVAGGGLAGSVTLPAGAYLPISAGGIELLHSLMLAVVLLLLMGLGWVVVSNLRLRDALARENLRNLAAELRVSASEQAQSFRLQVNRVSDLANTVDAVRMTSQQIQEAVIDLSDRTVTMQEVMSQATQEVERAVATIEAVRELNEALAAQVLGIQVISDEIAGALRIVKDFANQTQLLALNARIEAAGAGGYGRRFGVVANQIKQLADEALHATSEIRDLVERVKAQIEPAVLAAGETAARAEESAHFTTFYRDMIQNMAGDVSENVTQVLQIKRATEDQRVLGTELIQAIGGVHNALQRLTEQGQSVSLAAEQLHNLGQSVDFE